MVLRLYKESSCVKVFMKFDRLVMNELGNIEVRFDKDGAYVWKVFKRDVVWDSFVVATE